MAAGPNALGGSGPNRTGALGSALTLAGSPDLQCSTFCRVNDEAEAEHTARAKSSPYCSAAQGRPSWTEIDRSDQDCAIALKEPCEYLVGCDPFDFLTVLRKNTLQIDWSERLQRPNAILKCRAGHAASDASVPMASGEPDGLGELRPKEIKFKLNRTGHFTSTAAGSA
jgi:hypothetical protein